jgi:hypothetical protein
MRISRENAALRLNATRGRFLFSFFPFLLGLRLVCGSPETYTYPDLVQNLTDLQALAQPPVVGEKTELASSYDRRSKYNASTDTYVDWAADADGEGIVREEGNETVLADIEGPGCLVRMWAATAAEGHVKIFLDGNTTPTIDLPFIDYFDGQNEPFTQPALDYAITKGTDAGYDNYTPIPFQKSCKIVADAGWGKYFQFTYRRFPAGTLMPTFRRALSPEDSAALARANAILNSPEEDYISSASGQIIEKKSITAAPEKSSVVFEQDGPGAIIKLRVKFDLPGNTDAQRDFLRQVALRITWDGQTQPSVWSPWGDFFGDSAGATPFHSLPSGLGSDGYWYSNWYMPFASHAAIAVDNDSSVPVAMSWEIIHAPLSQPADSLLRFHAKWHRDAFLPQRSDREVDWTLLTTQGKGRYVGTQLHVFNPRGGWWGEGDDKFFIDGEKFPSTFGTGSEDYFGGGWGLGSLFDHAFNGMTTKADFNRGHISVHRWHIPDNVPFQTSFEGDIEKYYINKSPTLTRYAAVAFWYLDAKGADPYPVAPAIDSVADWEPPPIYHEPDAIEGEDMQIMQPNPPGESLDWTHHFDAVFLAIPPQTASNDRIFFWRAQKIGEEVKLGFKVAKAGKYNLTVRLGHKDTGGVFQLGLNGHNIGPPVDLYGTHQGDQIKWTQFSGGSLAYADLIGPINLGIGDLVAGDNIFSVILVGGNKAMLKDGNFDFLLDYIKPILIKAD